MDGELHERRKRAVSGFVPCLRSVESFRNGVSGEARFTGKALERLRGIVTLGPALASTLAAWWAGVAGGEMTGHEASAYLRERHAIRRTAAPLAKLRCVGGGPPFRKVGRDVIYDAGDLDAWAGKVKSGPLASASEVRWAA